MSTELRTLPRSARRRTRSEAREDNRRALLAAASEVITDVGYRAAQLDEIAARAGLTKGAIYSIFGGKVELLRALIEEHAEEFLPLLGLDFAGPAEATAEDVVEHLVRSYVEVVSRPDALQILAFELELAGVALRDPVTLASVLTHEYGQTERLARALTGRRRREAASVSREQAEQAAALILAALGGFGQRAVMTSTPPDAEVITAAATSLLHVACDRVA